MISAGRNSLLPSRSDQACALLVAGGRRMAAADEAEAGEPGEAEHEQAVAEIADAVAAEQAQRHQPPEGGIAEALGVGAVERADSSAKAANIAPASA